MLAAALVVVTLVVPPVPLTALPAGMVEPRIPPTAAQEPAATLDMESERKLLVPLIELAAPVSGATVVSTPLRVNAWIRLTVTVVGFNEPVIVCDKTIRSGVDKVIDRGLAIGGSSVKGIDCPGEGLAIPAHGCGRNTHR